MNREECLKYRNTPQPHPSLDDFDEAVDCYESLLKDKDTLLSRCVPLLVEIENHASIEYWQEYAKEARTLLAELKEVKR